MLGMLPCSVEDGVNAVVADWKKRLIVMENVIGDALGVFAIAL